MTRPYELIPGESNSVQFPLYETDGVDLRVGASLVSGDIRYLRGASTAGATSDPGAHRDAGNYLVTLTAAECTPSDQSNRGRQLSLSIRDQTATKDWLDGNVQCVIMSQAEVAARFYEGPNGPGVYCSGTGVGTQATLGEHGTADNPTNSITNALTLVGKLGVNRIYLVEGASVTVTTNIGDHEIIGLGAACEVTLSSGSACANTSFRNVKVDGTPAVTTQLTIFNQCVIDGLSNFHGTLSQCRLVGTLTPSNPVVADHCFSGTAGTGTMTWDLTAAAANSLALRNWSGGVTISNSNSGKAITIEGQGQLQEGTGNVSPSPVELRGAFKVGPLTNLTVTYDSLYDTVRTNLDATVSSRSDFDPAADTVSNVTTVASVTGSVGSVTGSVGSVTGLNAALLDVAVSSRSDFDPVADPVANVTNVTGNVAGSVGSVTGLNAALLDVAVSSRSDFDPNADAVLNVTNVTGNVAGSVGSVTGNVGGSVGSVTGNVGGSVASVTGNVGGNVLGSVASVNGQDLANLDVLVSSRSDFDPLTDAVANVTNVTGNVGGSVGSVTGNVGGNVAGSVGSVTGLNAALLDVAVSSRSDFDPAADPVANVTNVTGSVAGSVGSVTGSVGSVTGAVGSVTGAVGSVTGDVGGNVNGSVGSVTGLTAANLDVPVSSRSDFDPGADAVLNVTNVGTVATVTGLTPSRLDVNVSTRATATDVATALSNIHLDELISTAVNGANVANNSIVALLADNNTPATWSTFTNTTESLAAIAAGGGGGSGPTAAVIADAVWDEVLADHSTAGSTGAALASVGAPNLSEIKNLIYLILGGAAD